MNLRFACAALVVTSAAALAGCSNGTAAEAPASVAESSSAGSPSSTPAPAATAATADPPADGSAYLGCPSGFVDDLNAASGANATWAYVTPALTPALQTVGLPIPSCTVSEDITGGEKSTKSLYVGAESDLFDSLATILSSYGLPENTEVSSPTFRTFGPDGVNVFAVEAEPGSSISAYLSEPTVVVEVVGSPLG